MRNSKAVRTKTTLLLGPKASGKTQTLVQGILRAAETGLQREGGRNNDERRTGNLVATAVSHSSVEAIRNIVMQKRPLGCMQCEVTTFDGLCHRLASDLG